jgi:uncharacterized membrane protein YjfL (UPF0719 family)
MGEIGPITPYYVTVLLWLARTAFFAAVCSCLLWLGIRILDALTPRIYERNKIGESPISTGLFIGGFFISIGLVIHGASTLPALVGASPVLAVFNPVRVGLLAAGFFISLLVGIALFAIVNRVTPKIPFETVNKESIAVGIYVFSYFVFFGLIMHAALTTPL